MRQPLEVEDIQSHGENDQMFLVVLHKIYLTRPQYSASSSNVSLWF